MAGQSEAYTHFCNFANTPNNDYSAMNFSGADLLVWDTDTVFPLR
jgi:hypothetical protein